MITLDQKHIAKIFYGSVPKQIISLLRCATDLRNICAHYGRLYYRIFTAMPDIKTLDDKQKRSLWGALLALRTLYPSKEKWNNEIVPAIINLFEEYKRIISLDHIGFPLEWAKTLPA